MERILQDKKEFEEKGKFLMNNLVFKNLKKMRFRTVSKRYFVKLIKLLRLFTERETRWS